MIEQLKPYPIPAYFTSQKRINEENFIEWVEHKVGWGHSRHMDSVEWTTLEQEYRKEFRI